MKAFFKSRKFRFGGFATAFTIGFIIVVILINLTITAINVRIPMITDLTPSKSYTMSKEAGDYLKTVQNDITIMLMQRRSDFELSFSDMGIPLDRIPPALDQFHAVNPKIKVEYINLDQDAAMRQKYPNVTLNANTILIESGDRYFGATLVDLFEVAYDANLEPRVTGDKVEETLINKILAADLGEVPKVYLVNGHDEAIAMLSGIRTLLLSNAYEVAETNLATQGIPDDAAALFIAEPQYDYSLADLEVLDKYLGQEDRHTTLFVSFSQTYKPLPNFDAFLAEWGIAVDEGILEETDPNRHATNNPSICYAISTENDFVGQFSSRNAPHILVDSRPIKLTNLQTSGIMSTPLLQIGATGQRVYLDADGQEQVVAGPINAVTVTVKEYQGPQTTYHASILAVGSTSYYNASTVTPSLNEDVLLSLLNTLSEREHADVLLATRPVYLSTLSMTEQQVVIIGLVIFTILLPVALLVFGLVIWLRRRHL